MSKLNIVTTDLTGSQVPYLCRDTILNGPVIVCKYTDSLYYDALLMLYCTLMHHEGLWMSGGRASLMFNCSMPHLLYV